MEPKDASRMTQAPAKQDRYLTDFDAFERSQATDEPQWLRETRRGALARFRELGFPTARRGNEKWKYTNVAPIANASFAYLLSEEPADVNVAELRDAAPWNDAWLTMVFVNGRYSRDLSSIPAMPEGVVISNLAEAARANGSAGGLVQSHLAQYASYEDDAFAALNTAFLMDGALVHIPQNTILEVPLHLLYVTTNGSQPSVSYPRTLLVAGRNSQLDVIESYVNLSDGQHFSDAVTEIVLEDGAQLDHCRLLSESLDSYHVGVTRIHQAKDSSFSSSSFARGTALARQDLLVLLDAPGSVCSLNGLYMTSGTQHIDNYINIDHAKPHTTSRLKYKGIVDGKSRAVYGGTVLVRKDAQKADAQQSDKNLVLSDEAEVDSKPSLLIYADDVKCSHGATAGNIDEESVYYMRSRGLDMETASRLLIHGFASEIVESVKLEAVREYLDRRFLGALPNYRFEVTQ